MSVLNVNKDTFEKEVERFGGTVLIDFFAPECAPCKTMNPVVESVAEKAGSKVKVCKVNVEKENELAKRFGIMTIPTLVVMKNGEIINRSIGVTGKKALFDMLSQQSQTNL